MGLGERLDFIYASIVLNERTDGLVCDQAELVDFFSYFTREVDEGGHVVWCIVEP